MDSRLRKLPVFVINLEKATIANTAFRRVLYTTGNQQLVLMALREDEDIGMEKHDNVDQFIRIEKGEAIAVILSKRKGYVKNLFYLEDGTSITIPAGTRHNIVNVGSGMLHLYTIYSPPNHPPNAFEELKSED